MEITEVERSRIRLEIIHGVQSIYGIVLSEIELAHAEEEVLAVVKSNSNQERQHIFGLAYTIGKRRAIYKLKRAIGIVKAAEKAAKKELAQKEREERSNRIKSALSNMIDSVIAKCSKGQSRYLAVVRLACVDGKTYDEIKKMIPGNSQCNLRQMKSRGLKLLLKLNVHAVPDEVRSVLAPRKPNN